MGRVRTTRGVCGARGRLKFLDLRPIASEARTSVRNIPKARMDDISKPAHGLTVEETLSRERAILRYVVDNLPYLIFWKDRESVYLG